MRINQKRFLKDEELLDMTPMIDVVFQLLIFFLLSAKFIALETQIQSFLPKDQGLAPDTPSDPELVNVTFELSWIDDGPGEVICQTFDYRTPGSGDRRDVYRFQRVDGTQTYRYGPEPKSRDVTFGSADHPGYFVPDYGEIEEYLAYRKEIYPDPRGKGLPVSVNFDGKVPWGAVTVILDICQRLGITNFSFTAKELE